jgi:hypothetical protein
MLQLAILPDDVKQIIAGYYGEKLKIQLQNDIIDYSTYIRELVTNINRQQIQYKLIFWKILHRLYHSPNIPKKDHTVPSIGYMWGIMNHIERTNFIRYIL